MSYSLGDVAVMGPVAPSNWCSKMTPQPGCSAASNICKPMNPPTLDSYKTLQSQLNRIASKLGPGYDKIAVDGRIGPGTLALFNKCMSTNYTACDTLAAQVSSSMLANLKMKADALGAPAQVSPPALSNVLSPASQANKDGTVDNKDKGGFALLNIFNDLTGGALGGTMGIVVAGGLGFLAYKVATGGKKGGGRRKGKRSRTRARRSTRRRRR